MSYVCENCYIIQEKAKQTDAALKQHKYFKTETKCEDPVEIDDFNDSSNDDDRVDDDRADADDNWLMKETAPVNIEVKTEKHEQEKVKLSPKVTCRICGKIVNRSYYREHLTMHDPNPHQWVCEICGKSFRLRCAYHNHSLRHRNDFPTSVRCVLTEVDIKSY